MPYSNNSIWLCSTQSTNDCVLLCCLKSNLSAVGVYLAACATTTVLSMGLAHHPQSLGFVLLTKLLTAIAIVIVIVIVCVAPVMD